LVYPACLLARIADFRIVDVERPYLPTNRFEKTGLTRPGSELQNRTGILR
jgi:hypothetical protein